MRFPNPRAPTTPASIFTPSDKRPPNWLLNCRIIYGGPGHYTIETYRIGHNSMVAVVVDRDEGKGKGRRCLVKSRLVRTDEEAMKEVCGVLEERAEVVLEEVRRGFRL